MQVLYIYSTNSEIILMIVWFILNIIPYVTIHTLLPLLQASNSISATPSPLTVFFTISLTPPPVQPSLLCIKFSHLKNRPTPPSLKSTFLWFLFFTHSHYPSRYRSSTLLHPPRPQIRLQKFDNPRHQITYQSYIL